MDDVVVVKKLDMNRAAIYSKTPMAHIIFEKHFTEVKINEDGERYIIISFEHLTEVLDSLKAKGLNVVWE